MGPARRTSFSMHGDLGWLGNAIVDLTRPGGLRVFGADENVWLAAAGFAVIGPALATVAPRLFRIVGAVLAPLALALAFVATFRQQTMLALAFITFAVASGFVASWSAQTLREMVGPYRPGPQPRHRPRGRVLTRAQGRSFDYLAMRTR
jgi:hypothetical protein